MYIQLYTSGAGTAYPSGAPVTSPLFFCGVGITRSLILCVCFVDCCFGLFLLAIVFSVLLRFTDSGYPFGIFKLFYLFFCILYIPCVEKFYQTEQYNLHSVALGLVAHGIS